MSDSTVRPRTDLTSGRVWRWYHRPAAWVALVWFSAAGGGLGWLVYVLVTGTYDPYPFR